MCLRHHITVLIARSVITCDIRTYQTIKENSQ